MEGFALSDTWTNFHSLYRLTLALGLGLFVGLEREWRGKEAGLRTFGFAALLGAMGGMLGDVYGPLCISLLTVLVVMLNLQSLRANQGTELTTSAALLVIGMCGVFCGKGHTITPAAVGVVTAGLLAWKERLAIFSHNLTAEELRAEILLAILTFAIYPVLPQEAIDPWNLIEPRTAWMTVILVAATGFVNYVLWRLFGEKGLEMTGFFGGLVNSNITVTELSHRAHETDNRFPETIYRAVLLATMAMSLRNAFLLAVLAFTAFIASIVPLLFILVPCAFLVWNSKRTHKNKTTSSPLLSLSSPFSILGALKFGLIFLILQVIGALASEGLGQYGFYAVSIIGGLISSASAVASAAALVSHQKISASAGGTGAVFASVASAAMQALIVYRYAGNRNLAKRIGLQLFVILTLVIACLLIEPEFFAFTF
jgi:uncharacterized membrane protein (DUF4010 family)